MASNRVISKAGTYTLQEAPPVGYAIELTWAQYSVRSNNTVTFDYTDPPYTENATSGRDIGLPPAVLEEGQAFTVTTTANAKTTIKWTSRIVKTLAPQAPPPPAPRVNCVVGAWSEWSAWTPILNSPIEQRTRTRDVVTPAQNGGSACPALSQTEYRDVSVVFPPAPSAPPPAPTPSGDARMLASSDLQYLGAMRCPADTRMDFSYGSMTGRKVDGVVHLLMPGNVTLHDPLYEFADTESYSAVPESAPRMSLVRAWGDVYGFLRTSWDDNGVEVGVQSRRPGGYYWHEGYQLLYWTYQNIYNTSQIPDWCLGASQLNGDGSATAYGPWRPEGARIGARACTRLAQSPSGEMLCGATLASGNISSPWGPDLWAGTFPTAGTPAGYGNPNLPLEKYLTYYPMVGSIALNGTFTPPLRACRRPGTYVFEPFENALTQIDPTLNSGVGSWTDLDYWHGVTWIDLPDRYGVLFTGSLAAGHVWYASVGMNNATCTHGIHAPVQITGPVSTDAYPAMWFYDPNDLISVRSGDTTDYTVNPVETVNAESTYGLTVSPIGVVGSAKTIAGQYFDPDTRRLYVCAPEADNTIPGYRQPLIHVFLVN